MNSVSRRRDSDGISYFPTKCILHICPGTIHIRYNTPSLSHGFIKFIKTRHLIPTGLGLAVLISSRPKYKTSWHILSICSYFANIRLKMGFVRFTGFILLVKLFYFSRGSYKFKGFAFIRGRFRRFIPRKPEHAAANAAS